MPGEDIREAMWQHNYLRSRRVELRMRDEGDMIAEPAGSLTCLGWCAALGGAMILFYVLLTMALVLLA